jgi:hypothetical protein
MISEYKKLLPVNFHADSRVWIYQSDRAFNEIETTQINELLSEFTKNWTSHGAKVKGFSQVFFNQFIVLIADETASEVSGCSTDSSVRIIKNIEETYQVSLFNRQLLGFFVNEKIELIPLQEIQKSFESEVINTETLYFNNIVLHKKELEENWIIPLKNSWLRNKIV